MKSGVTRAATLPCTRAPRSRNQTINRPAMASPTLRESTSHLSRLPVDLGKGCVQECATAILHVLRCAAFDCNGEVARTPQESRESVRRSVRKRCDGTTTRRSWVQILPLPMDSRLFDPCGQSHLRGRRARPRADPGPRFSEVRGRQRAGGPPAAWPMLSLLRAGTRVPSASVEETQ